jgi:hypothetical protein
LLPRHLRLARCSFGSRRKWLVACCQCQEAGLRAGAYEVAADADLEEMKPHILHQCFGCVGAEHREYAMNTASASWRWPVRSAVLLPTWRSIRPGEKGGVGR